jgi:hypothetical protein
MFLRGAGTNATGSSSGAVGQPVSDYAADTYLNHTHTDSGHTHTYGLADVTSPDGGGTGFSTARNVNTANTGTGTANIQNSTTGGTETKPKNYGVLYIIKT